MLPPTNKACLKNHTNEGLHPRCYCNARAPAALAVSLRSFLARAAKSYPCLNKSSDSASESGSGRGIYQSQRFLREAHSLFDKPQVQSIDPASASSITETSAVCILSISNNCPASLPLDRNARSIHSGYAPTESLPAKRSFLRSLTSATNLSHSGERGTDCMSNNIAFNII